VEKIPSHLRNSPDPLFDFNRYLIDATADHCVAYKPNTAFYEAQGSRGWESLQKTLEYIPDTFFKIADAKRGDIGNTATLYARAFFEHLQADAVTVNPYMGHDSVQPFLAFPGKWAILLALTSNPGADDFQCLRLASTHQSLFETVLAASCTWGTADQLMFVVGATRPAQFQLIRQHVPEHFLLVPGIGSQGGDLEKVSQFGFNAQCGLLVNASRSILYASTGPHFAQAAAKEASILQSQMAQLLEKYLPL
jgi:orotidine-5'-phosphate decarboxylase